MWRVLQTWAKEALGLTACAVGWHAHPLQSELKSGVGIAHRCPRCGTIVRWTLYSLSP